MRLQRLDEFGAAHGVLVFRRARLPLIMASLIPIGLGAGFVAIYLDDRALMPGIGVAFCSLMVSIFLPVTFRAFTSANWVIGIDDGGVWLKFTPRVRKGLLRDEPQVAHVPFPEIDAITAGRRWPRGADEAGSRIDYSIGRLELLPADAARASVEELAETIARLRTVARTGMSGAWPVSVRDGTIVVRWRGLTPGIAEAVNALKSHVAVRARED